MAYATVHRFAQSLKVGGEVNLPLQEDEVLSETDATGKLKIQAKRRNEVAMANFAMAFTSEGLLRMIYKSQSTDWPNGKAHLVVEQLMRKYKPQDTITIVEMRQRLAKVSMRSNEDPSTLFEQLSVIANLYYDKDLNRELSEEEQIATILTACPKAYETVLITEQRSRGVNLKLEHLEEVMTQFYRQTHNEKETEDENEITLTTFEGECYNCGEKGHRANKCPKPRTTQGFRSLPKCTKCDRFGHMEKDCWEKDENKEKRPEGWKPRNETTAAMLDEGVEFLLFASATRKDDEHKTTSEKKEHDQVSGYNDMSRTEVEIAKQDMEIKLTPSKWRPRVAHGTGTARQTNVSKSTETPAKERKVEENVKTMTKLIKKESASEKAGEGVVGNHQVGGKEDSDEQEAEKSAKTCFEGKEE